jgi:N-acetylglutamate synthase-like GNAT family acetyltransferase
LKPGATGSGSISAMPFFIRSAVPGDLGVLRDLFVRSSLANEHDREALLAHPDVLEWEDRGLREGRTRVAATAEGRIVGFATWVRGQDALEVEDLFVDPEWMGRGAGRELVLDLTVTAREQGLARLEVTADRQAAGFYERVGFFSTDEVQTRFGPALRMRLNLASPRKSSAEDLPDQAS